MSKNISQIAASIQQWLAVDSEDTAERLPTAICIDLINWSIKEYCRNRESRFGEISDTFPTVIAQREYVLPTGFSKPRKIWYTNPDTGSIIVLGQLNKDAFDVKYPDSTAIDDPADYTIWAQQIQLGKTPKRVLTLKRDYWGLPADLSGTQENSFTIAADQYLLFKSLAGASLFGLEDDRMPTWESQAAKLEANIDSEDSRRLQTGRASQSGEPG